MSIGGSREDRAGRKAELDLMQGTPECGLGDGGLRENGGTGLRSIEETQVFRPQQDGGGRTREVSRRNADGDPLGGDGPCVCGPCEDGGRKQIALAEKTGHERRGRPMIEFCRGACLEDAAPVHDAEPVRQTEGFLLVVGDMDEGESQGLLKIAEFRLHLAPQAEVEGTERFVEEDNLRLGGEGPGEGDALLLTARQLRGQAVGVVLHADEAEHPAGAGFAGSAGDTLHAETEGHIFSRREMGEEGVVLEDHVDRPGVGRLPLQNGCTADCDGALIRKVETGDEAQGGAFAAARGSQQREEFARSDAEGGVADDGRPTE